MYTLMRIELAIQTFDTWQPIYVTERRLEGKVDPWISRHPIGTKDGEDAWLACDGEVIGYYSVSE